MTLEQEVFYLLRDSVTEVEGRVHPLRMPQNCLKPALVYKKVSDIEVAPMSGWCEVQGATSSKKRMQVSVFAEHYSEQKSIEQSVKTALKTFGNKVKEIRNYDLFEDETELYHGVIEFKI